MYTDEIEDDEQLGYAATPDVVEPQRRPIPIHPDEQVSQPMPQARAQAPVPATESDSGFDFGRFFAGLGGGNAAVSNLDSMRAGKANQALAQRQEVRTEADYQSAQQDKAIAKRMAMARIDPASNESRQARLCLAFPRGSKSRCWTWRRPQPPCLRLALIPCVRKLLGVST